MQNSSTNLQKSYKALVDHSKKTKILSTISQLLEWDMETYMPEDGYSIRSQQLEYMAGLTHKERSSKQFIKNLEKFINLETGEYLVEGLTSKERICLKEWRRDSLQSIRLPNSFVKEFAKTTSLANQSWAVAKKNRDFSLFMSDLKKLVTLSRQKSDLLGYENHPYDAHIDLFEPEMTTKKIGSLFDKLKPAIQDLLTKILSKKALSDQCIHGTFDTDKQLEFGRLLLKALGYDEKKGRLDLSNHPFSMSLDPNDSRITTRIHQSSVFDSISAVMHECGHSLYEMGLPIEDFGTPICEYISLGIHESQSRFYETRIGQSLPFWSAFYPKLQQHFKPNFDNVSLAEFYQAINKVNKGPLRLEADEVSYSLHIILRFELERALIEGSLEVEDLPEAWNIKSEELLNVRPKNDAEGCLQDIHWAHGTFGYFPTYTLGNLYASQFFQSFEIDNPQWETELQKGELIFIKKWLNENIHSKGRLYSAKELVKKVTGSALSIDPFISYLAQKYGMLYGF